MATIHTFNTGRLYTEQGQRIAWTVLSTGNIGMVDVDRHIDYVLTGPSQYSENVNNRYVLDAYDNNDTVPWNAEEYAEFKGIERELKAEANKLRLGIWNK